MNKLVISVSAAALLLGSVAVAMAADYDRGKSGSAPGQEMLDKNGGKGGPGGASGFARQQFELDRLTCQTDAGDTKDCMAVKGYVSVPKDQAAAKQQQLAANAAQNAAPETVSGLPPLRPTTPPKGGADKKQKSKPAASPSSQN